MATLTTFLTLSVILFAAAVGQKLPFSPPHRFLAKKFTMVHGRRMAYVEVGHGDPIVFLHGNPTSSYLWRNVMPFLESQGRLIAPDLIGMGSSAKLPASDPNRYNVHQHANFLFGLLEKLHVKKRVTFVVHDWGAALGFYWAYVNRRDGASVKGIAFMEAVMTPFTTKGRFAMDADMAAFFKLLRSPAGEHLVLRENFFVEEVLPMSIIRNLTKKEMDVYRKPYRTPGESRRATLTWARQIPINGRPRGAFNMLKKNMMWLKKSKVPKLFIRAKPGVIGVGAFAKFARSLPNVKEVTVPGIHFLQEDSPHLVGEAVSKWLSKL